MEARVCLFHTCMKTCQLILALCCQRINSSCLSGMPKVLVQFIDNVFRTVKSKEKFLKSLALKNITKFSVALNAF